MLQVIAFDGIRCDHITAEEVIEDFLTYAQMAQVRPGLYIDSVPLIIDPSQSLANVCERYHNRRRQDNQERAQHELRSGEDRRRFLRTFMDRRKA